jgi:nitrite reductase (NADH) large subunit
MVAHRLVEALVERDTDRAWQVDLVCEEHLAPYDRVGLTSFFSGRTAEDLLLGDQALWDDPSVTLHLSSRVARIDTEARQVVLESGAVLRHDALVLATGSSAFVPPVPGRDLPGVFVYRAVEDVVALRRWVEALDGRPLRGAVMGGGLLGLEAAGALRGLGVDTTVVELADRLMPMQVDAGGGEALRRIVEGLGVTVRTGVGTSSIESDGERVTAMTLSDGSRLPVDVVVVAAGVRPRDELGRQAGLPIGERGGVVVDEGCSTPVPDVYAVGEVACIDGRCWGLVGPGNAMAEVVVDRLLGGDAVFPGADTSTKLKLLGVDVASFGDAFAETPGALEVVYADPVAGAYKKLVLSDDARTLLGGVLVGDAAAYTSLRPLVGTELEGDPTAWLLGSGPEQGELPDAATVCSCNNVAAGTIRSAVSEEGACDLAAVKGCTKAGTSCGSCLPLVKGLMTEELRKQGVSVSNALCEHFELSRAQLFDVVRLSGLRTFSEILETHGRGRGCDICRPVVASVLASLGTGHVLDADQARLQDTNDHVMANLQKDGTYTVVPRIPGGEVTPEKLIVIVEVA